MKTDDAEKRHIERIREAAQALPKAVWWVRWYYPTWLKTQQLFNLCDDLSEHEVRKQLDSPRVDLRNPEQRGNLPVNEYRYRPTAEETPMREEYFTGRPERERLGLTLPNTNRMSAG